MLEQAAMNAASREYGAGAGAPSATGYGASNTANTDVVVGGGYGPAPAHINPAGAGQIDGNYAGTRADYVAGGGYGVDGPGRAGLGGASVVPLAAAAGASLALATGLAWQGDSTVDGDCPLIRESIIDSDHTISCESCRCLCPIVVSPRALAASPAHCCPHALPASPLFKA
jgi:hypothetical protein